MLIRLHRHESMLVSDNYYSESVTYMLPEEEPTAIPTGDKRNDTGRYNRFI